MDAEALQGCDGSESGRGGVMCRHVQGATACLHLRDAAREVERHVVDLRGTGLAWSVQAGRTGGRAGGAREQQVQQVQHMRQAWRVRRVRVGGAIVNGAHTT